MPVGREEVGLRDFGSGENTAVEFGSGGGAHEDAVRGWVWAWGAGRFFVFFESGGDVGTIVDINGVSLDVGLKIHYRLFQWLDGGAQLSPWVSHYFP